MGGAANEDNLSQLRLLEVRLVWQRRGLILLTCALGCLALYVVNVIRPPDDVHADAVETLHVETTAIKFLDKEARESVAFLTTWPLASSDLPAAPPEQRVFTPQLMLRDPGRADERGRKWTRRVAFDLTGDMPALAFYDTSGDLKALLTILADGPVMELRDPTGGLVFTTRAAEADEVVP